MSTANIIDDVRSLRVLVLHRQDSHAEELLQQVTRIGCRAEALWPLPKEIPEIVDLVFLEITEARSKNLEQLFGSESRVRPTLIGVTGYENPSVMQNLLELYVDAVVTQPLRASGVLSSMIVARRLWHESREYNRIILKLKKKLSYSQDINQAKYILMHLHGVNEEKAYESIRSQAMAMRKTTVEIAQAIINADGVLGNISESVEKKNRYKAVTKLNSRRSR